MKLPAIQDVPGIEGTPMAGFYLALMSGWQSLQKGLKTPFGRDDGGPRRGNCYAKFDELLTVKPDEGDISIYLPKIAREDVGRAILVASVSTSTNALVVSPVAGQLVNGLSSFTVHQLGYSLTMCMAAAANEWVIARLFTETRSMLTPEGGTAVRLINKTGADSIKGTVVDASTTTDDAFAVIAADAVDPIGVVYEAGVADGEYCWVVREGRCQVLLENSTAATHGNWVKVSDSTAGRADASTASPPGATTDHLSEIGHCLESVTAGTDKLCYVTLHFN